MNDGVTIGQTAADAPGSGPCDMVSFDMGSADCRLSDRAEEKIQRVISRYPVRKSAVMPALYIAQEELGWCSEQAISWVATRLGLTKAHVKEVSTFYTMYYKNSVGKYHIQVCRTLSCMLCGGRGLVELVKKRCGLVSSNPALSNPALSTPGSSDGHHPELAHHCGGHLMVSENGFWSMEEVECLGSCGTAPMIQINDVFFENLTDAKLTEILDRIEREEPNLRYSTLRESLGKGMPDHPRSEAW